MSKYALTSCRTYGQYGIHSLHSAENNIKAYKQMLASKMMQVETEKLDDAEQKSLDDANN